ncbi:MAG TPA: hypothetical protein VKK79_18280 [Candidatus Lokiarchaeia archaeon]|nr:hypothetical protein [Candidatus Lokiarchaeia archaeon]
MTAGIGGEQSRFEAQHQREECLTTVVANLFTKLGYNYIDQPEFIGELSPDILAQKGDEKVIIELKAYTKRVVCAEPEFAQAIKYAQAARDNEFGGKIRSLLITSGNMVPSYQCGFYCGGDVVEHTLVRYSDLLEELKQVQGMDKWDAKGIYMRAEEKVRKATWIPNEMPAMDVKTLEDLQQFLDSDDRPVLLGCMGSAAIKDAFQKLEMTSELRAFKNLESTPLRVLMQHPTVLNVRRHPSIDVNETRNEEYETRNEE